MSMPQFILYRIYYESQIAYVGRTKQPLQNRIRGHLMAKPMQRTINIDLVTKIEYTLLPTEADMNLYEIYYILKWHPPLNVDDKTRDYPTVSLPELEWRVFTTPLWDKWVAEIHQKNSEYEQDLKRYRYLPEEQRILRSAYRTGEIDEESLYEKLDKLNEEKKRLRAKLYGKSSWGKEYL